MALKHKVEKIEEVEEQYRGLYAEEGGAFILQVDDNPHKAKVDEFRGNNIELQKKLDALEASIEAEKKKKTDQAAIASGDAERLLAEKEQQLAELTSQLENLNGKVGTYEERYKGELEELVLQLPEDMRKDYEGVDTQQGIKFAKQALTLVSKRKPFEVAPKAIGKLDLDQDISKLSPQDKLAYVRQQKGD